MRARGGRPRWGGPNYNLLETHGFGRTIGRLPGRTRPRASVSSQMRGVPRGWWLGGSCGFVLQLRYVAPKIDVFLVQIAASADSAQERVRMTEGEMAVSLA